MTASDFDTDPEMIELINQYQKWRRVYSCADQVPRDEPVWQNGRLNLRAGYPYPDWTGYVVEPDGEGCNVLTVTTERRSEPLETLVAYFSDIEDAGRYIILKVGEHLRIRFQIDPIQWKWEDSGLDHRVRQVSLGEYASRFELKEDPARYFILQAGSIQPENHLLVVNYDELNEFLLQGLPTEVIAQLGPAD